jgi:hypothetical protein
MDKLSTPVPARNAPDPIKAKTESSATKPNPSKDVCYLLELSLPLSEEVMVPKMTSGFRIRRRISM